MQIVKKKCYCGGKGIHGSTPLCPQQHHITIAFLCEKQKEVSLFGQCVNTLVSKYTKSEIIHCEIVIGTIGNNDSKTFTYSVDGNKYKVHAKSKPSVSYLNNKWIFVDIPIEPQKELDIIEYLNVK
jgi:hypothetical protein